MNDLGSLFEYGIGVPKNSATAIVWYERAAESGHIGAMTHLGELSEAGVAVPQDFTSARRRYEKAASLGCAAAMNSLAKLLLQDGNPSAADQPSNILSVLDHFSEYTLQYTCIRLLHDHLFQSPGLLAKHRILREHLQRKFHVEFLLTLEGDLQRRQGMAPEAEEIVMAADSA